MFKKSLQAFTKAVEPTPEYHFANELKLEDEPSLNFFSELVGGLIHKQNNQIAIVQGYSNLLSSISANDQMRENISAIDKASNKLTKLNFRIIDCIPGSPLSKESVSVVKVIDGLKAQIPDSPSMPKVEIDNSFPDPEVTVNLNETALRGALSELLQNSIQASASRVGADTILISLLKTSDENCVGIEVKDWGGGIPDETLPSVFKPFFSTRQKQHAGIGLTRAAVLTHRMGGEIGVKSENGTSCVLLRFPKGKS